MFHPSPTSVSTLRCPLNSEVRKAMRSKVMDDDGLEELINAVVECLEEDGVVVGHY
jgi:hypothetical protein